MVNVYENGTVIAEVKYNENLDMLDSRGNYNRGTGRHLGLTRLADGRYVLIHGTNWQGEDDTAEIITAHEAFQHIIKSNSTELLKEEKFAELNEFREELIKEA